MSDTPLEGFQSFDNCTEAVEQSAVKRLTVSASTKTIRCDVEFALAIVNQCNQLFSKRVSEIRKAVENSSILEGVERMLRVVVSAFKFLHRNRSAAGFSVLALEKTMSNFNTACANAHLGLRAWDCLGFLRRCLLEHAETHTVVASSTKTAAALPTGGRVVRNPAAKLVKNTKKQAADTERISTGMRRLSLVRDSAGLDDISMAHFSMSYNRGDASFNILVVTLLCNVLRVLSQVPTAPQTLELMPRLSVRAHSALEWCLRLRDVDSATAEPFLGVCFRAYYALGANDGRQSLDIRALGLAAYASTKACDVRELLKYAVRASARAESLAKDPASHAAIGAYYSAVAEQARPLLSSGGVSPEMADFYYRWALACRSADDLPGALSVCSQVALRSGDTHAELVACALACNCLVQHMLACGQVESDALPAAERMAELAEHALGRSARHTLSGWNALAMCADISRKTAKRAVAELRDLGAGQDCVSGAVVQMLDASDRIYEAYISRGAALRAQEAGGSSVEALRSCSAEVCLLAVQLIVQYREHDSAAAARHSDRLLQLCGEPGCSPDFLRSHSTVFFNRGASLYQLKSYGPAALAMERAIDSLALWMTLTKTFGGDVVAQLCKRYEISALAFQADSAFLRASQVFGRAVAWISGHTSVLDAIKSGATVLPVGSSLAAGEVERLLMFVDRYVRMCAARLARDSSEPQARKSLLDFAAEPTITDTLRAWVCEAEAFFWRPFVAPSAAYALDVRAARLQSAVDMYSRVQCSLGHVRCLVELAKIDRDRGNVDQCVRRLQGAVPEHLECVYGLSVAAERHAWLGVVAVERDGCAEYAEHLSQCSRLWTRVCQVAEASSPLDTGHLLGVVVGTMGHVADLLMSRRMYSATLDVLQPRLDLVSLCEPHDRSCAPLVMQTLVDLGTASLLLGRTAAAAEHFRQCSERYEDGVLPVHVEIASKIAYAEFCLVCADEEEGARAMCAAAILARNVLGSVQRSARSKRPVVSPETMVLFSKASQAYSVLSLKQGLLADAVDFGLHSYRILHSLLRSLGAAHARAKQEEADRLMAEEIDDPFAKEETKPDVADDDEEYWQYIAFSGNWELQRLLIDNLAHLSEIYSLRGSVKEAEYFLQKALAISAQLCAPRQEGFLRLREADILSRRNMWDECTLSLAKARGPVDRGELEDVHALVIEGDAWRRSNKFMEADDAYKRAQELLSRIVVDGMPLVLAEDLAVRRRLLDASTGSEPIEGVVRRCIDQRPEHLLMRANVAFAELQRLLAAEPAWTSVLQSALVFPALRHSQRQQQQPRKGSTKALVRDCLAELDALLVAAAESAITVGSAHCVHESCHLLALTRAMSSVFGLSVDEHGVLARIVDDARNITAVREAVDAIRRKKHSLPASLTQWPADALESSGERRDGYSPSSSPSLGPRRGLRQSNDFLSSPSMRRQKPLLFGSLDIGDSDEEATTPSVDFFGQAANGTKVVAGWTSVAADARPLLRDCLPASWVACSISIDALRNIMFVTRYEQNCEPLVICLPMREIELDSDSSAGANVFGDLQSKLAAIVFESDQSMKTGGLCTTEDEKRGWWEIRSELDRRLGKLLACVETEWLGGFKDVLRPDVPLLAAGEGLVDVESLRRDIQTCVVGCLSKSFAAKAKSMELSDQLCLLVLSAATRASGDDGEWLDVCSMIWDVYCYQGAAPVNPEEDVLNGMAENLRLAVAGYVSGRGKAGRKQLILILDKHAQQVPWECLPCLRDYPISRVPSVAFLQNSIAASTKKRSDLARPLPTRGGLMDLLGGSAEQMLAGSPIVLPRAAGVRTSKRTQPTRKLAPTIQPLFDDIPASKTVEPPSGAMADGTRVFYVLNPEGDLHRTQANFEEYLKNSGQQGWHGVIGRRPTPHECERGLASDIFMYFGHGGAENYISRTQIRGLSRCAVALLFGCSSGQLKHQGEYDAMGTAVDYLIAGCPALVGNLWDVGDKDIDRFAARLLAAWGLDRVSAAEIAVKSEVVLPLCRPVSLAEAVCEARKACRMSFLTGAAPVVYGIPVYLA
ncbi:separin protein [Coemansia sp. S16]|nr:separin protein [Coemansia sp. S3946]KAJ2046079.1 separin protein [Coemansia sp. S16]